MGGGKVQTFKRGKSLHGPGIMLWSPTLVAGLLTLYHPIKLSQIIYIEFNDTIS